MNRWDVINKFIKEREYKSYLEIGYYKGWSFDQVVCNRKLAVDPNPCRIIEQENATYGKKLVHIKKSGIELIQKLTSDDFFAKNKETFDIIFIDGLHEAKQVEKDIINSLQILNPGGVILLHDCNPPTYGHTTDGVDGCWNGDVYKTIINFKAINPNVYVIDTDWGIGVIEKFELDTDIEFISELDWSHFEQNRISSIGLISIAEFEENFSKKQIAIAKNISTYTGEVSTITRQLPQAVTLTDTPTVQYLEGVYSLPTKELVFVSVQPDDLRFSFQVEVFIENTIKIGYTNDIHILMYVPKNRIPNKNSRFLMLEQRYKETNPNIKFFWYEDFNDEVLPLARSISYIPLLRPWTLKKHFEVHPELSKQAIFYHDNDIIFTKYLDFTPYLNNDICYLSDTSGYMNADYFESQARKLEYDKVKQKQFVDADVLGHLAKMNGITKNICIANNKKTGGAQQLLKNIDATYWDDVFNSTITIRQYLYYDLNGINAQFFKSEDDGIQSWCADMWAVLWNVWKRGMITETPADFNFVWATDDLRKIEENNIYIYHDAGATDRNQHYLFNKNKYEYVHNGGLILPYTENLEYVSPKHASIVYVNEINNVKTKYNYGNVNESLNVYTNPVVVHNVPVETVVPEIDLNKELKVCAIMATCGRHKCAERALGFFLNQDYKNSVILIYQNSNIPQKLCDCIPQHLRDRIILVNQHIDSQTGEPYTNLGAIYNDAIKYIPSDIDLVCFWDDDDAYTIDHISEGVKGFKKGGPGTKAYKPKYHIFRYLADWNKSENTCEPSYFVDKNHIIDYGFGLNTTPQHIQWIEQLGDKVFVDPDGKPTFIYDWSGEIPVWKTSGDAKNPENWNNYHSHETDHGDSVLTPASVRGYLEQPELLSLIN